MKIREILKAVLFVAGIVMFAAACNKKDDDLTLDFDITVPSGWSSVILNTGNVVFYAQSPLKANATPKDTISEDLTITKDEAGMSLSSFFSTYINILDNDTSFHKLSVKDTTINGTEAIKLIHLQTILAINQAKHDSIYLKAKIEKYVMINNNYAYIVGFNALTNTYDEYKEIFDNIIATFVFKK
jgi:hypothetical protein